MRGKKEFCGGIQVVIFGDFLQLPPIADNSVNDPGDQVFTSEIFKQGIPHKVVMKKVKRQQDLAFSKAVNKFARGEISHETVTVMRNLNRPLENVHTLMHLYARNIDVDLWNFSQLDKVPGETKTYRAETRSLWYK